MGTAIPGSTAINFHGSFAATTKVIQAKDLGIPVGTIIFVSSIRFEYAAAAPTILSVSLTDFATKGDQDVTGPRSPNHLATENSVGSFSFKNPNSLLFWSVVEESDVVATVFSSNAGATLTFAGTVQVRLQGAPSHNIS